MTAIFKGASRFNRDIGDWDVSRVVLLDSAFEGARRFNVNLDWDTSSVVSMRGTFKDAVLFDGDLSTWKVGDVLWADSMFERGKSPT